MAHDRTSAAIRPAPSQSVILRTEKKHRSRPLSREKSAWLPVVSSLSVQVFLLGSWSRLQEALPALGQIE